MVEDVQETRDAIKQLLLHDGYRVDAVQETNEAVEHARRNRPDLVLVSLQGTIDQLIATSKRIRRGGHLGPHCPVVIFSVATIPEGTEQKLSNNIYVIASENFDQLRGLFRRLLHVSRPRAQRFYLTE